MNLRTALQVLFGFILLIGATSCRTWTPDPTSREFWLGEWESTEFTSLKMGGITNCRLVLADRAEYYSIPEAPSFFSNQLQWKDDFREVQALFIFRTNAPQNRTYKIARIHREVAIISLERRLFINGSDAFAREVFDLQISGKKLRLKSPLFTCTLRKVSEQPKTTIRDAVQLIGK